MRIQRTYFHGKRVTIDDVILQLLEVFEAFRIWKNVTSRTRQPARGVRVYVGVRKPNPNPNPGNTRAFTPGFQLPVPIPTCRAIVIVNLT